jgi:hypothetical protein
VDATPNPTAVPNAIRIVEKAVAISAPATAGVHAKYPACGTTLG